MSLWFNGAPDSCDLCGHVETGRSHHRLFGAKVGFGDFVFWWDGRTKVCHWCAVRLRQPIQLSSAWHMRQRSA